MPQIFLSYSRADASKIDELRLIEHLHKDNKYHVWRDTNDIQGGKLWLKEIQEAIESSIAIVVFVTNSLLESESQWVMFECAYAIAWGVPVIPYFSEPISDEMNKKSLHNLLSQQNGSDSLKQLRIFIQDFGKKSFFEDAYNTEILILLKQFRLFAEILSQYILYDRLDIAVDVIRLLIKITNDFVHPKFGEFWLKFHPALNTYQRRNFQNIVDMIEDFRVKNFVPLFYLFYSYEFHQNLTLSATKDEYIAFRKKLKQINRYIKKSFGDHEDYIELRKAILCYKKGQQYNQHGSSPFMPLDRKLEDIVDNFFSFLREDYKQRKDKK